MDTLIQYQTKFEQDPQNVEAAFLYFRVSKDLTKMYVLVGT